jgi:hypothetical protein
LRLSETNHHELLEAVMDQCAFGDEAARDLVLLEEAGELSDIFNLFFIFSRASESLTITNSPVVYSLVASTTYPSSASGWLVDVSIVTQAINEST